MNKRKTGKSHNTSYLMVRIAPDQKEQFGHAARAAGLTVSSWVRSVLVRAAKKESSR